MKKLNKKTVKEISRFLRKNQTESEDVFWQFVRNRKLFGKKFLRQHAIKYTDYDGEKFFVVDFYCAEKKLIVELDGKIHDFQKYSDDYRTNILKKLGFTVIRFKNEELSDFKTIIKELEKYLR